MCLKVLALAVFMVRKILLIKDFCVVDTQWLEMIDLKFGSHSAGAPKVKNLVRFFTLFFPVLGEYEKGLYWNVLQKYWKYWKHGSSNAWKERISLSFCLKSFLRPDNSVQGYDSVKWLKHLILMNRGRKAKLPKLLKVSFRCLVLVHNIHFWFGFNRSRILCCIASKFWNWIVSP